MALDKAGLEHLANRITQQSRRFNTREGVGPSADTLPERFFQQKTTEGASLSREELERMIADYNAIREAREV